MRKKIEITLAVAIYALALILIVSYFILELNKNVVLFPIDRLMILLSSCFLMFIGDKLLTKNINKKYKRWPLKINIIVWFILYVILLSTLTLFDDYFNRNSFNILRWNSEVFLSYINTSFNIIPFKTISSYFIAVFKGNINISIFMYNIFGNIIAFIPFAFFLPVIFKKQNKFLVFFVTMLGIVLAIELLQFATLAGSCDIDDMILNVSGACIMFGILKIKPLKNLISKIKG